MYYCTSYAQDNMIFIFRDTPQKALINPALTPIDKFYISLPILGSLDINANSSLKLNSIFSFSDNNAIFDKELMINNIKDNNVLNTSVSLDILNMGFKIAQNGNLNFSLRSRVKGAINYNKDIFSFLIDNPIENDRDFNIKIDPNFMSWAEFGIAYSHTFNNRFSFGLRTKLIMGAVAAQSRGSNIIIKKDFENYYVSGRINLLAGNLNLQKEEDYFSSKFLGNMGYALDFGFAYKSLDNRIMAHASISDLGKASWGENSSNIVSTNPNKVYKWGGIKDIESLINNNNSFDDQLDNMFTSLKETIGIDTVSLAYKSSLPYHIQFGGSYSIDNRLRHTISINNSIDAYQYLKSYYQLSLAYKYSSTNKRWDLICSYTYKSHNPFNIGLGALYRGRSFEIFLVSDSINSFFNVKSAASANIRLGINFYKALDWIW